MRYTCTCAREQVDLSLSLSLSLSFSLSGGERPQNLGFHLEIQVCAPFLAKTRSSFGRRPGRLNRRAGAACLASFDRASPNFGNRWRNRSEKAAAAVEKKSETWTRGDRIPFQIRFLVRGVVSRFVRRSWGTRNFSGSRNPIPFPFRTIWLAGCSFSRAGNLEVSLN